MGRENKKIKMEKLEFFMNSIEIKTKEIERREIRKFIWQWGIFVARNQKIYFST